MRTPTTRSSSCPSRPPPPHNNWTTARQHAFIASLAELGLVAVAARDVKMSPKSAYARLKHGGTDSGFARAWWRWSRGRARALDLGIAREVDGAAKPVFYGGRQIAQVRHYDSRLLLAALRAVARQRGEAPAGFDDQPWRD